MNHVYITFPAVPENERMARMMAAAFLAQMDPTMDELDDIKTAVSEAVTNCIIHAYEEKEREGKEVELYCEKRKNRFLVKITDKGKGISDIKKAMEPLYTSRPREERAGMGFSFMEAFMDHLDVQSEPGKGTCVTMEKEIGKQEV